MLFLMWIIFKLFIQFVTILPLLCVLAIRYVGFSLNQGLNLHPLHREGEVLTTGLPRKFLHTFF